MFTTFRHLVKRGTSNFPGVKIPLSIHRNVIGLSPFSSAADDSTKIYRKIDPADIAASKNTNLNVGHKPYKYVAPFEKSAYADTKHTTGSISSEIDLSKRKLWKKVSPIKEKTDAEKAPLLTPLAKRIKHKPGSAGTKSSKSGGKGTNSYTRLFKADKISEFIATAFERRQSELLMEAYVYAENNNIKLTLDEYTAILWSCSKIANPGHVTTMTEASVDSTSSASTGTGTGTDSGSGRSSARPRPSAYGYINNGGRALEALDIYRHLKSTEATLPSEVFHYVMSVCAQFGSANTATTVLNDYRVMKLPLTPELLADYVVTMAKYTRRNAGSSAGNSSSSNSSNSSNSSSGNSNSLDKYVENDLYAVYQEYLELLAMHEHEQDQEPAAPTETVSAAVSTEQSQEIEETHENKYGEEENEEELAAAGVAATFGSEEVFTQMARTFSQLGRESTVIDILKHYVNAGFEPSFEFCSEILENALVEGDAKTLVVLSNWFLGSFDDVTLPEGCIEKMLQIGCGSGNSVLASNSVELLRKCGYPVMGHHYAACVAASTTARDLPSILEALVDATRSGIDLYNTPGVDGFLLQDNISIYLSYSLKNMDELYYAVVDLIRQDEVAPAMAVNAIIAAAGMNSHLDRAFATMQECSSLFNLPPTVHTYNALLCAVVRSPDSCFMKTMLTLFEKMDDEHIQPNAMSYSLLIDAMIELTHYQHLEDILAHLLETNKAVTATATARGGNKAHVSIIPTQKSLRRLVIGLANHPQYHDKLDQVLPLLHRNAEGKLPGFLQRRLEYVTRRREAAMVANDLTSSDSSTAADDSSAHASK